ncbi:hypothetical protein MPR_2624 [Myroides profundi]|nr:hypothetical protein MPR_2624 [Myroides profundi]
MTSATVKETAQQEQLHNGEHTSKWSISESACCKEVKCIDSVL